MTKLSKYKDCGIVGEWVKSIINHLHWCAASAPDGDGDQMVVRWQSLANHIMRSAWWLLSLTPRGETKKVVYARYVLSCNNIIQHVNYITGSKAFEQLNDLLSNKHLLIDIAKLSPQKQTSGLESYHSVVNHFAPKVMAFSYVGMHCRYCTYLI